MSSFGALLKAGGQASALREQERQLRSGVEQKIQMLHAVLLGTPGNEDADQLILNIHKVPQQDHAHGRLSQGWVAIQKAKGIVGNAALQQFNKELWLELRKHPVVRAFEVGSDRWSSFFEDTIKHWLHDALNAMQEVVASPAMPTAPALVAGPLPAAQLAHDMHEHEVNHFQSIPFPGTATDDVQAILSYLNGSPPIRKDDSDALEFFTDIIEKSLAHFEASPASARAGHSIWVPHQRFLEKALAKAQVDMV